MSTEMDLEHLRAFTRTVLQQRDDAMREVRRALAERDEARAELAQLRAETQRQSTDTSGGAT